MLFQTHIYIEVFGSRGEQDKSSVVSHLALSSSKRKPFIVIFFDSCGRIFSRHVDGHACINTGNRRVIIRARKIAN